jgi:cell division protein FtsN
MSKIDYITIAVVVVCISLLGLVFWKVADLNRMEENNPPAEELITGNEAEEPTPFVDETYDITDFEGEDSMPVVSEPVAIVPKKETEKIKDKPAPAEPPVELKPKEKVETPKPEATIKEEFLVWGGSFSTRAGAEEERAKFVKLGYPLAEVALFDKGKFAVVIVGRYPSQTQAQALVDELQTKHRISAIAKKKRL